MGKLEAARLLFEEAVQVSKEMLCDGHPYTLIFSSSRSTWTCCSCKAMVSELEQCGWNAACMSSAALTGVWGRGTRSM
jgi:hypothetical protein|tara:strand:+ start:257 stop:490 length:234 start_codon:yes stop_codon:yes gene_type:complete